MTWSLAAHGTAENPEAERELQERLNEVLSSPEYGTAGSQLATSTHNGPVHEVPKATRKGRGGSPVSSHL